MQIDSYTSLPSFAKVELENSTEQSNISTVHKGTVTELKDGLFIGFSNLKKPGARAPGPGNNQQSTINNQQSTINNQQSTINNQQSTINNQQSTINYQLSTINYQLSTINYQL